MPMPPNHFVIYADGACRPNPGRGGWAAIIISSSSKREISGSCVGTTNNRMEILAAINGILETPVGSSVIVYSDSTYLVNSISRGWSRRWKQRGWMRGKKQIPNADLFSSLLTVCSFRSVSFKWLRGHSGHKWNELADQLSRRSYKCKGV